MEPMNLKIFKLDYSGSFEEVKSENIMELFSLFSILAIYVPIQKRMYIWIGKNANQSLKKHIAQTRALFSTNFPELKILRNITIESGSEPSDFFQFIGFDWEELNDHLKKQEEELNPIIKKVNDLLIKQNKQIDSEKYEEAIRLASKISDLSNEIKNDALKREQKDLIVELKQKLEQKTDLDEIREEISKVRKQFEELAETKLPQNIIDAHNLVHEFKEKFQELYDLDSIKESKALISKEDKIWNNFNKDRKYAIEELDKLSKEINRNIQNSRILEADEKLNKAKELLLRISDQQIIDKWTKIESNLLEIKLKSETIEKIEDSIKESSKLSKTYQFQEAISKINSTLKLIQDEDILEYNKRLTDLKNELERAEKEYRIAREQIENLAEKISDNRKNNQLNAAMMNCESIVAIAEKIDDSEILLTYSQISDEIEAEIQQIMDFELKENTELINKAKELEKVIEYEEDVLPLLEEFPVEDILGDLSDDLDEILAEVGNLLEDHRVEVREEISNKTVIKSATGEALELTKDIEIEKKQGDEEDVKLEVRSGLSNPFEDIISEAIITDLIPYNYEITDISFDETLVEELPDKTLRKEGIELEWKVQNIPPKEQLDIKYDLRRRVSRTIIFILKGQLKIIKTHSNLKTLELEGLYEATLPFNNSFGDILKGVIVEDIIPLYYLHFIKEPTDLLPAETSKSSQGELIKWNVGLMEEVTINYQYRLLELYRLEELKININRQGKNGLEALKRGDLTEALKIYDEIITQLEDYNK
jgi:hypothetical protein